MKTGLSLSSRKISQDLLVGETVPLHFNITLQRGAAGLTGIDNLRLVFSTDNPDNLEEVPSDIMIELHEEESCRHDNIKEDLENVEMVTNFTVAVKVVQAGRSILRVTSAPLAVDTSGASVELIIKESRIVDQLIVIIGWTYFFLWSVSFYPQIFENHTRQSVAGLNMDFVIFNVLGFLLYSCFNINLYFSPAIQAEYLSLHPGGTIPVELNDVVFSCHATLATIITLVQCFTLDRAGQTLSSPCQASLVIMLGTVVVGVTLATWGIITWLTCLYILSYIKLVITLVKYIPQAGMNYRKKSTQGWSIENILLDLLGGLFSMLQMVMVAYNNADWTSLTGDPTKLGLAALSMAFDAFFMLQHFVLYRKNEPYTQIS